MYPRSAAGTAESRVETTSQSSTVAVGIRSKAERTSCAADAMTFRSRRCHFASCNSRSRRSSALRSVLVTSSIASTGSSAASLSSVARVAAAISS